MHRSESGASAVSTPGAAVQGAWATLFLTTFPQTVLSLLNMAPPVMAKALTAGLGLSPEAAGLYIGVVYVCAMASNMRTAALMARFGPLRLSFACVAAGGLGMALFAFGTRPAALAATLLIGLGYGPLTTASSQVLARHGPPRALALFLSVRQTSVPLGGLLAGLIVPSMSLALSWADTCVALGLGTAALALAVALAFPAVRREQAAGPVSSRIRALDSLRIVLASPGLRGLAFGSLTFSAMQVILTSFLVVYLTQAVGLDLVAAGFLLSANQVAGVIGRIAWGHAADRVGRPRDLLLAIGLLMAAATALASLFSLHWPLPLIGATVILLGATASGWNGVFLAEVMRAVDPARAGLATSGSLTFTYLGVVLGPPLFGIAAASLGYAAALAIMAGVVLIGGLVLSGFRQAG